MNPTPEQSSIISAARAGETSLMVGALAGTGKTTAIRLLSSALPKGTTLALAFNKKIAVELEKVLPPHFQVKTMNGLGHSAFSQALGKRLVLDTSKLASVLREQQKAWGTQLSDEEWDAARKLISAARTRGLVPLPYPGTKALLPDSTDTWQELCSDLWLDHSPDLERFVRAALVRSIKLAQAGTIDFDDQIYMSTMFTGLYAKFDQVLVDEAQDLSPLNHRQLALSLKPSGRLVVVGDPKQAIYAFRGASSSSMERIRELRAVWTDLPLTTTWRCPKAIVARQWDHAPAYRAAESAPEGEVLDWQDKPWSVPAGGDIAIICRMNAPIISLAFKLIRQRVGVQVLGRDIGKSLVALLKKLAPEDATIAQCATAVNEWIITETSKAAAMGKEDKIGQILDRGESLLAVIDGSGATTRHQLIEAIEDLFKKEGRVVLATGHKAKGLEWATVIHLDPWRIPSKWALKDPKAMEQELNLRYVIETRAKRTLILANLEEFDAT